MSGEWPGDESPEAEEIEKNPEAAVDNATATVEIREAVDSNAPKSTSKIKEFFKNPKVRFASGVGSIGVSTVFRMFGSLLKFAKEVIMKKGQVGFKEGYAIGQDVFPSDDKEGKK